jgi:hypothetical protein
MIITLGRDDVRYIGSQIQNADLKDAWFPPSDGGSGQERLIAYVGTTAEFIDSVNKTPNGALIAPYTVFIEVQYTAGYVTSLGIHLPVDAAGLFNNPVPIAWSAPFNDTAITPMMLNSRVDGNNIITAYYKIPRGTRADMAVVTPSDGLMYFAEDYNELYVFHGTWRLIASPPPAAVVGLMYGWSEMILAVPSAQYLKCDGSVVPEATYPDLYATFTQGGYQTSPFEDPANPSPIGSFRLPKEANTIIRALI